MNSDVPSFTPNFWGFFENVPLLCKENHFATRKPACQKTVGTWHGYQAGFRGATRLKAAH